MASMAPAVGILGMGAEGADMSTMLRRRRLLVELDWRCRIDAHDRQFTGRRAAGVHVQLEVIPPGICRAGRSPAMLDATGLDGAG
jgi:hypothetical protein